MLVKTGKCPHAAVHSASGLEESHIFTAEMQKQIRQQAAGRQAGGSRRGTDRPYLAGTPQSDAGLLLNKREKKHTKKKPGLW